MRAKVHNVQITDRQAGTGGLAYRQPSWLAKHAGRQAGRLAGWPIADRQAGDMDVLQH